MTLLITIFAAIISTFLWYKNYPDQYKISTLCFMFWGASLMWTIDAIMEYREVGAELFTPGLADMLNDTFLGIAVVCLGMIIWIVSLLISDPKGVVKAALSKK